MDTLHPIKPGDPIRVSMLNKLIDGAKIALDSPQSGAGEIQESHDSSTIIDALVVDAPLPCYAVLSIDGSIYDPATHRDSFLQEPAIRVGRPHAGTQNFAILQRSAVVPNQVVPACVAGVSIVELSVVSAGHEFAVPNDSFTMTSAESGGAKILWKQDSPGNDGKTWALVSFPATVGGVSHKQSAVVMESIPQPSDTTQRPPDGMGKIALFSKTYDENTPYDDCTCLELAYTEQLLTGQHIVVEGPFDIPDHLPYYIAIETLGEYTARLNSSLNTSGTSTIIVFKSPTQLISYRPE